MRILVAVDDSKASEAVIKNVTDHFKTEAAEIKVMHVLTPIEFPGSHEISFEVRPELEEETERARTLVQKYAEQIRTAGYAVDCVVERGDPSETIADVAARWEADLIVLGSHGRKGIARLLLGNVAYSVVRKADCSVWIVRQRSSD